MELVMERIKVFENYLEYGKKIKELLEKHLSSFELFIFGSVVKGNFSIGLSDIDIAIVSDEFKNRNKKLEIYDLYFLSFSLILLSSICLPKSSGIFTKDS